MSILGVTESNKRVSWCKGSVWTFFAHPQPAALNEAILCKHSEQFCSRRL